MASEFENNENIIKFYISLFYYIVKAKLKLIKENIIINNKINENYYSVGMEYDGIYDDILEEQYDKEVSYEKGYIHYKGILNDMLEDLTDTDILNLKQSYLYIK